MTTAALRKWGHLGNAEHIDQIGHRSAEQENVLGILSTVILKAPRETKRGTLATHQQKGRGSLGRKIERLIKIHN